MFLMSFIICFAFGCRINFIVSHTKWC